MAYSRTSLNQYNSLLHFRPGRLSLGLYDKYSNDVEGGSSHLARRSEGFLPFPTVSPPRRHSVPFRGTLG